MFEKLNLNWSAVWRKGVVGGLLAALMGYTYKANKIADERIDAAYPKPSDKRKQNTEDPS